ncbi:oligopeptidase A [Catenovulum agarivorans DS-2]|uniref:oligopeptidase A n=1 Tax=Catenovulum agarivorans DS-2 TaxID=1328313 RepID=W7QI57_9ALTE|nr:oligopeptidase A [Catenovulum agarivorans]EWH11556.1 oligopeptidase A [Catenovulum agarivorans DS-2]
MSNPLLSEASLPEFANIKPEHILPAVEQAIAECKSVIEQVVQQPSYSWQNFVQPIDEVDDKLSRIWSPVSHLHSVADSEALRQAYEACLPLLSEYSTYVGQHQGLYQAYQQIADSEDFVALSQAQQKAINDALRGFKLSGVSLPDDKKKRFGEISQALSELTTQFSNNVLDATQGWRKEVSDEKQLAGLPESAIAAAKQAAESKSLDGWLFNLEFPSYLPVMMYADDRSLREEIYRAFATRASDQGPNAGKWDNSKVMQQILELRYEKSQLLDFASYADLSLATKMAESPQQVSDFLYDLANKSKKQAQAELAELTEFAKEQHGIDKLEAWDMSYYAEKLKQQKYAISDEVLRPYFPEEKVISGLFATAQRLFSIEIKPRDGVQTWHESVRFYDIFAQDGQLKGSFYFDLYAREGKRGGAWMDVCVGQMRKNDGELQLPVAYLTCNFNKPVGDKPALFTHNEVETLFHEFGHGLHHMLTQVDVSAVAGINGVAWDAVELPSQFLENWCWQPEALGFISGHYETGEPLPQDLLDKMLAAKNFQSAMMMMRQLEFSLFDFELHHEFKPAVGYNIQQKINQVREKVAVVTPPEFNRFQHSFSHIFAGGYAAGYYSYKWAEVLSSDAFSRFEEEGIFNAKTGHDFLEHILQKGGSQEPMELFKAFRGREPKVDALLRHSGIEVEAA